MDLPFCNLPSQSTMSHNVQAIIDSMVLFYRECLEANQRTADSLRAHVNEQAETNRYLHRQLDTANGYIGVLETRLDSLYSVCASLLQHGHPTTRAETVDMLQEERRVTAEPDLIDQLLNEVDTEEEDEDAVFTGELLTAEDVRAIDLWLEENP